MPSDDRADRADRALEALDALAPAADAFLAAVAVAAEEVRREIALREAPASSLPGRVAAELGVFGTERIDAARLGEALGGGEPAGRAGGEDVAPLERALAALAGLEARGHELFRARVGAGESLAAVVDRALAEAGRAFGAARTVELARTGAYRRKEHGALCDAFGFGRWNRAERAAAPPLVVEVDGADLLPGGLAEFLDGRLVLVLVVRGPCSSAPLARLVTPGVRVIQTDDPAELRGLPDGRGPAVAALVPEGAALFSHHPAEKDGAGRLEVRRIPGEPPARPLGRLSAWQQVDEVRHLMALAAAAEAGGADRNGGPGPEGDEETGRRGAGEDRPGRAAPASADRLAAWLLRQARLPDPDAAEE